MGAICNRRKLHCHQGSNVFENTLAMDKQKQGQYYLNNIKKYLKNTSDNEVGSGIGLKFCAMGYFVERGLFKRNIQLIQDISLEKSLEKVNSLRIPSCGLTVRLSRGEELGLPRGFFEDRSSLLDFITKHYSKDAGFIIYDYIQVEFSYEIVIDRESWFAEAVPGLWESDNLISPDRLHSRNGVCRAAISRKWRSGVVCRPSGKYRKEYSPVSHQKIRFLCNKLEGIVSLIRDDLYNFLPLNVHFVEDELGDLNFINLRRSRLLSESGSFESKTYFQAKSVLDIDRWNGVEALVLDVPTDRGEEKSLVGKVISRSIRPFPIIYLSFGLLSHPAIVLRELGFTVRRTPDSLMENNLYEEFYFKVHHKNRRKDP
jgi:hypothetical protein